MDDKRPIETMGESGVTCQIEREKIGQNVSMQQGSARRA